MKSIATAYLSFLLFSSVECLGKTGLEFLQAAPTPVFKEGHTLLPLTRWSWPLTVEMNVALAERWGYALDVRLGRTGEQLDNPNSDASRLVAISQADPSRYPIAVMTRRVMFEWDTIQGLLSPDAWCWYGDDTLVLRDAAQPVMKPYVSDADALVIGQAEVAALARLKNLGVNVSVILNGSEYMPGVPGNEAGDWHKDQEVDAWVQVLNVGPAEQKIAAYSSNKAKEEQAVRDAVLSVMPGSQVIYYVTGDSLRGIISEEQRLEWVYPYRFMINGGTLPSWQFYFGADGTWMPDSQKTSMPVRATNSTAQGIEGGRPLSYNWLTAGWSLTDPSGVSDDKHYMGFLKFLYTLGSIGNVAGYFSYPPGGFDGDLGGSPPDWLRQIIMLSHAHATFTHLESYLRQGDLLPGDGNHVYSIDLYGNPSWPHPAYEFATNEGSPSAKVAARKLNDKQEWLIIAWATQGVDRQISVFIPQLGNVTLLARAEGSLYRAKPGPILELLDPDGMDPSRNVAGILAGTYITTANVALASNGGVASASSAHSPGYPAWAINNGERAGTNWNAATVNIFPDWVQVNFNGAKIIDHVIVYSVQDDYLSPVEPTDTMNFSLYGLVNFTVQGWDGANWVTLAKVSGNNLVKRTVNFSPYSTDRIRINVASALNSWRLAEVEVWGN